MEFFWLILLTCLLYETLPVWYTCGHLWVIPQCTIVKAFMNVWMSVWEGLGKHSLDVISFKGEKLKMEWTSLLAAALECKHVFSEIGHHDKNWYCPPNAKSYVKTSPKAWKITPLHIKSWAHWHQNIACNFRSCTKLRQFEKVPQLLTLHL